MKNLIIWIVLLRSVVLSKLYCPPYCACHMRDEYKYVGCINKGLISIELDVPQNVEWLQLSNNSIHTLYNNAFYTHNLIQVQRLDLNRNGINTIQQNAFYGMTRLVTLDLSFNHLYTLDPWTFDKNTNLIKLDLSSNPLRALPEPFLISASIQMLYIKSCNLGYIQPGSLSELPNLRVIVLSNNQLIRLQPSVLERLNRLHEIDLSHNHLQCNGDTYDLLKALLEKGTKVQGVDCQALLRNISQLSDPDNNLKPINKKDEKFQRMVLATTKPTTVATTLKQFEEVKDEKSKDLKCEKPSVTIEPKNSIKNWFLLFIVFFSGLGLGALLAYTSIAMFSLYWRCQKRRRELNRLDIEMTRLQQNLLQQNGIVFDGNHVDPNAPPPNYYQLFGTIPHISSR